MFSMSRKPAEEAAWATANVHFAWALPLQTYRIGRCASLPLKSRTSTRNFNPCFRRDLYAAPLRPPVAPITETACRGRLVTVLAEWVRSPVDNSFLYCPRRRQMRLPPKAHEDNLREAYRRNKRQHSPELSR
jgi:hypothetical protein